MMKMKRSIQMIDYSVDVASGSYGLANIQTILGIVLLVLSIASILFKMGFSIYTHIKNKQYQEIQKDLDQAKEEIEKLKDGDLNE